MGDGGAEGLSTTGVKGQAAVSLRPAIDGTRIQIFESLKLEGSYVGDSLYKVFSTFSFCFLGSLHYTPVAQTKALEIIPSFPTPTLNSSVILYLISFK